MIGSDFTRYTLETAHLYDPDTHEVGAALRNPAGLVETMRMSLSCPKHTASICLLYASLMFCGSSVPSPVGGVA
ncbi:hypothetical protein ACXKGW_29475, partial [Klebsiella pneumoniae subsp. pneumoniae]